MDNTKFSFNKSLERLEEITRKLEEPNLDIEEALKLLQEGVSLHKACKEKLTKYDSKIKEILREENSN